MSDQGAGLLTRRIERMDEDKAEEKRRAAPAMLAATDARIDEIERGVARRLAKLENGVASLFGLAAWFWLVKPLIEPHLTAEPYAGIIMVAAFMATWGLVSWVWKRDWL